MLGADKAAYINTPIIYRKTLPRYRSVGNKASVPKIVYLYEFFYNTVSCLAKAARFVSLSTQFIC